MKCPYCFSPKNKTTGYKKSYESETRGHVVRRQRVCLECGNKFYSIEFVDLKAEVGK
jgi:transcriptional regulator NrdR family protein